MSAASGTYTSFNGSAFHLVGDTANGGLAVTSFRPMWDSTTYKANVMSAGGTVDNLTKALAVISTQAYQSSTAESFPAVVNFVNASTAGHFAAGIPGNPLNLSVANLPFPGTVSLPEVDDFETQATAMVTIPAVGQSATNDWTFDVNSDDGYILTVTPAGQSTALTPTTGSTTFTGTRTPADSLVTYSLPAGVYQVTLTTFNRADGAESELWAAQGDYTSFGPSFELVGDTLSGGLMAGRPSPRSRASVRPTL